MTNAAAHARSLIVRAFCKLWECVLRARTLPFQKSADPTQILLDYFTPEQRRCESALAEAAAAGPRRVLVIVPFRDRWPLTEACLASLFRQNLGARDAIKFRVVLLDNASREPETRAGIAQSVAAPPAGVEVVCDRVDEPFNYSKLNNRAVAAHAAFAPDYLLFLNNDVEFRGPNDVADLVNFANRCKELAAVGCTLLYPDGRTQHLFVAPGVKIVAAHPLKGARLPENAAWFAKPRPVAAVTGAVMLVPTTAFQDVGGFDERLPSVGQDVDLCLRLREKGRVCWALPQVRAAHHEGASRPSAIDKGQVRIIYEKWGKSLLNDAFYSSRFSRWSETPVFALGEGPYPWEKVLL